MESEFITICIPCETCDGKGFAEYERVTRRFFDPYQHEILTCQTCGGTGEKEVNVEQGEVKR